MKQTALLLIDIQSSLIEDHPDHEQSLIHDIQTLLTKARETKMEVIFVRHDDGVGTTLTKGMTGWDIYEGLQPLPSEKIFDKFYNSAFKETGLQAYLKEKDIQTLIITGLQCEYCIDTTIRVAFELGYQLLVPKGCTSTFSNTYLSGEQLVSYYEQTLWNHRFATIVDVDHIVKEMAKK